MIQLIPDFMFENLFFNHSIIFSNINNIYEIILKLNTFLIVLIS